MGFWDPWEGGSVISRKSSHKHHKDSKRTKSQSRSRHRHHGSPTTAEKVAASIFGGDAHHQKHNRSSGSFFGLGDDHYSKHNRSSGSFFNLGNNSRSSFFNLGRSSSYYKRQPRSNFVERMAKKLKRLLRDLVYYAKRHPFKVFMLIIMPLVTGGALTALLARFGLRLPPGIERMLGIAVKTASGDTMGLVGEAVRMASNMGGPGSVSVERGRDGGMQWERRTVDEEGSWGGGLMSGMAKMFL